MRGVGSLSGQWPAITAHRPIRNDASSASKLSARPRVDRVTLVIDVPAKLQPLTPTQVLPASL
jgi:hypothetical protein